MGKGGVPVEIDWRVAESGELVGGWGGVVVVLYSGMLLALVYVYVDLRYNIGRVGRLGGRVLLRHFNLLLRMLRIQWLRQVFLQPVVSAAHLRGQDHV